MAPDPKAMCDSQAGWLQVAKAHKTGTSCAPAANSVISRQLLERRQALGDYETQIDLGDEAADNYGQCAELGSVDQNSGMFARRQYAAQLHYAHEAQRSQLAAGLLLHNATLSSSEWLDLAAKAMAAAAIIYPGPKESR